MQTKSSGHRCSHLTVKINIEIETEIEIVETRVGLETETILKTDRSSKAPTKRSALNLKTHVYFET